jgi:hypothetical protein
MRGTTTPARVEASGTRLPIGTAATLACIACLAASTPARSQDAEPRSYSNAPVGTHFLIAGYVYTQGGIAFDPALPIENVDLTTSSGIVAYATAFDVLGLSAKFDAIVPYTWLSGSAEYQGEPVERDVNGFADPRFRVSVNLYGAPALSAAEFAGYRQDLIVGVSLQVQAPWGQYDSSRLVNIGTNRWWVKPELGVSKALGPWTLEFAAGGTFYADNDDFYGGKHRSQDPLYSMRGHAIYNFRSGIWASLDATWFVGGRTTVNGILDNNLQQNWRVGATLTLPVDRQNSVKFNLSSGVSARTGNGFDLAGIAWQYRWGGV